ncbi:MAG: cell envelope integrity protein CreD [Chromatiaceae bacterium]|nr:cell envelope integrity protein CreD [Chromatiaceae bacterium]
MQQSLLLKALITAILAGLLLVPIGMIHSTVGERQMRQDQVRNDISGSFAGAQRVAGPVLVLPYVEEYSQTLWENEPVAGGGTQRVRREHRRKHDGRLILLPELAELDFDADTDFKRRGLFKVLVYGLSGTIKGRFELAAEPEIKRKSEDSRITWGRPFLSLSLTDTRGLSRAPILSWDGTEVGFEQGTELGAAQPNGLHARLPQIELGRARTIPYSIDLGLRGTESVGFEPLAGTTRVALTSAWPHPSFQGRFLPDPEDQHIDEAGFSASWEVTALATTAPRTFLADVAAAKRCASGCPEWFGVRFIEPVDVYSMADRALKYAFLFVALTFAAFFLFELLESLRIHPAQYLLVGLALAIFFLMLLSLSEHIPFGSAYLISAVASIGLQGFYLSYVLGSARRGIGFAASLAALFSALYGLLVAEDVALLMGSLLLFGLLATAMVMTRKFDWYAVGNGAKAI